MWTVPINKGEISFATVRIVKKWRILEVGMRVEDIGVSMIYRVKMGVSESKANVNKRKTIFQSCRGSNNN